MKTRSTFGDLGVTVDGTGAPDIMQLPTECIIDLFKSNGVLLFTGFDTDTGVFERFTNFFFNFFLHGNGFSVIGQFELDEFLEKFPFLRRRALYVPSKTTTSSWATRCRTA